MEKLTLDEAIEHAKKKTKEQRYYASFEKGTMYQSCTKCAEEHEQLAGWLEELKEYKQLEEQGLLLKLPCKIGNTVYVIDIIYDCKYDYLDCPNTYGCEVYKELSGCEYEYEKLVVRPKSLKFEMLNDFGKTVFLTREEAEKELERLNEQRE